MDDTPDQPAPDRRLTVEAHEGGVEALPAAHDLVRMDTRDALRRGWALVCLKAAAPGLYPVRRAVYVTSRASIASSA